MMTAAQPPSLAMDISDDITNDHLESPRSALAFEIEMEGQNSPIPKGLEKRLAVRSKTVKSWSKEEIDQKLILAERRRKEFLDWLSNKAKPKQKVPSAVPVEELTAKLEARLSAAEAKRTALLARDQDRLAAYFASHEKRLARRQRSDERRCAATWAATWRRLVKAEQRREACLQAERVKASKRHLQAREIARSVLQARDQDAKALQEKLEEKLVRALTRRQQLQQERASLNLKRRASRSEKPIESWQAKAASLHPGFVL